MYVDLLYKRVIVINLRTTPTTIQAQIVWVVND